jgi:hypothetical protein
MTRTYLICLLDAKRNDVQRGVWSLRTHQSFKDINRKIGAIRRTMGLRWCVDIQLVDDKRNELVSTPGVVGITKQIADKIREHERGIQYVDVVIPSNTTTGSTDHSAAAGPEYLFNLEEEHRKRLDGR